MILVYHYPKEGGPNTSTELEKVIKILLIPKKDGLTLVRMSSVCNRGSTVEVKSTDLGKAKALMEKYSDGGFQEEDS